MIMYLSTASTFYINPLIHRLVLDHDIIFYF